MRATSKFRNVTGSEASAAALAVRIARKHPNKDDVMENGVKCGIPNLDSKMAGRTTETEPWIQNVNANLWR